MFATITNSGSTWMVKAPGRRISGFGSYKWAANFIETMGWVLWTGEEEQEQQ